MSEMAAGPRVDNVTGKRIGAAVIDAIIFIPVFLVFSAAFGDFGMRDGRGFQANLTGIPFVGYVLTYLAYNAFMERQSGGSFGKLAVGIRVVSLNGGDLTWSQVIIRNVLRIVDGLPFFYLLGFIVVAVTANHQRIGDLAAGTALDGD